MQNKKDMMDYIIESQTNLDPIYLEFPMINDYPETIQGILKLFLSIWMLPSQAVPSRKNRGQYKQWVLELNELETLCAKDPKKIMTSAYEKYVREGMSFMVTHPASIKRLIVSSISSDNRKIKSFSDRMNELGIPDGQPVKETPKKEVPSELSPDDKKKMSQSLRRLIEED